MKKLVSLLLVVAASSLLASTVRWSLTAKSFGTSDGSSDRAYDTANGNGYLVTVVMASDLEAAKAAIDNFSDGIADFEALMKSSAVTGKAGSAAGNIDSSKDSGETEDFYIISFDSNTLAGSSNYIVSDMITGTTFAGTSVSTTTVAASNFASSSWAEVGTASQDPDPGPGPGPQPDIPEPSVAVLGLVGAGLLFKRRK